MRSGHAAALSHPWDRNRKEGLPTEQPTSPAGTKQKPGMKRAIPEACPTTKEKWRVCFSSPTHLASGLPFSASCLSQFSDWCPRQPTCPVARAVRSVRFSVRIVPDVQFESSWTPVYFEGKDWFCDPEELLRKQT